MAKANGFTPPVPSKLYLSVLTNIRKNNKIMAGSDYYARYNIKIRKKKNN